MRFATPLIPATLIRRYKRFLADIRLDDGTEVTAHCPNPGAMLGLDTPSARIWVEPNDDPKKKLKYGWRLVELGQGHMAGIDTSVPNRVVREALAARQISGLSEYETFRAEVPYGTRSRIDFALFAKCHEPTTYIEVKNVHLRREADWAEFPDCVTQRGTKHLKELSQMARQGKRAVMLYVVQRTDCARFKLAADLDPDYAKAFAQAYRAGVEMLCFGTKISFEGVFLDQPYPVYDGDAVLENSH